MSNQQALNPMINFQPNVFQSPNNTTMSPQTAAQILQQLQQFQPQTIIPQPQQTTTAQFFQQPQPQTIIPQPTTTQFFQQPQIWYLQILPPS